MKSYKTGAGSRVKENNEMFCCSYRLFNVNIYFIVTFRQEQKVFGSVSHLIHCNGRLRYLIPSLLDVWNT